MKHNSKNDGITLLDLNGNSYYHSAIALLYSAMGKKNSNTDLHSSRKDTKEPFSVDFQWTYIEERLHFANRQSEKIKSCLGSKIGFTRDICMQVLYELKDLRNEYDKIFKSSPEHILDEVNERVKLCNILISETQNRLDRLGQ